MGMRSINNQLFVDNHKSTVKEERPGQRQTCLKHPELHQSEEFCYCISKSTRFVFVLKDQNLCLPLNPPAEAVS